MKKNLSLLLIFVLIALLSVALIACDNTTTPGEGDDIVTPPVVAELTVRFDSDGGTSMSSYNTKVQYGQTISAPAVNPIKKGYVFGGWTTSSDATNLIDFSVYTIIANTTFKASWTPAMYANVGYLTDEGVKGNISGIDENQTVADYYGDDVEMHDASGNAISETVEVNGINVKRVSLSTSYQEANSTVRQSLSVPKSNKAGDYFVYWYYRDADGNAVRFTQRAKETDTTVQLLTAYNTAENITLYAMWYSAQPNITITYELSGGKYASTGMVVKDGDTLDAFDSEPTKDGYDFEYWYYYLLDDEGEYVLDSNGNRREYEISFYQSETQKGTEITESMMDGSVFPLYAKWQRAIHIANGAELAALDITDAEVRTAHIYIDGTINQSGWNALFNDEFPFEGVLDGGIYTDDVLTGQNQITLTVTDVANYISLIGVNYGEIKNLSVRLELNVSGDIEGDVYVGAIASKGQGILRNVTGFVTGSVNVDSNVYLGGISAVNNGAEIDASTGTVENIKIESKGTVSSGGIVGRNYSGPISESNATYTGEVTSSAAYVGGVAGRVDLGSFYRCQTVHSQMTIRATDEVAAGGLAGKVFGSNIDEFRGTDISISAESNTSSVGGIVGWGGSIIRNSEIILTSLTSTASETASVGGAVGFNYNEGGERGNLSYIIIKSGTVKAIANGSGSAYAGGIVGQNYAGKTSLSTGTISYSYSAVDVEATAQEGAHGIGQIVGLYDAATVFTKVYFSQNSTVTLNNVLYVEAEGEGNFELVTNSGISGIVPSMENIRNSTWLRSNLNLNPNYTESNPDTLIWLISDGSLPELNYLTTPTVA